jgi:hypothetical protein
VQTRTLERVFDRPRNEDRPPDIPVRPMGRIPVLARLVYPDRTVWAPARAIRWTDTHVLVLVTDDENDRGREDTVWLRAQDVTRRLLDRLTVEPDR